MPLKLDFVLGFLSFVLMAAPAAAGEQDSKSIEGRIKLELHEACIKINVFLTNKTDKEIGIVTGAGGVPRSVVPSFFSGSTSLVAAKWNSAPRREMKPEPLTLNPGDEMLYDAYVLPLPPGDTVEGVIYFRALDKPDQEYIVKLGAQKFQIPIKDQNSEKKK